MATATNGTDDNGNQNYQGKLYEFTSDGATEMTNYGQGTKKHREPDTLSSYDNNSTYLSIITGILTGDENASKYENITAFKATMQEDYNAMIKSVKKYGGFYIGRYEMSKSTTNTNMAASIANATPLINDSSNRWYGVYAYGKTYNTSSVESSMLWGSQYDAMMRWMQDNQIDVTAEIGKNRNTETITGTKETDIIKNIYDLYGCHFEWTLEAYSNVIRVCRGGYHVESHPLTYRHNYGDSNSRQEGGSSRFVLYLK